MNSKVIILGTAQLMSGYGKTNFSSLSLEEIDKIFKYSFSKGIHALDTAPDYGDSEKIIGDLNAEHSITTKIPILRNNLISYVDWIDISIQTSLLNTKRKKITNLLFHSTEDMIKHFSNDVEQKLNDLRSSGLIENIGFSVYDADELSCAMNLFQPNLVQFPLNPFDQRFLEENLLIDLARQGISSYARSIFLQGILISDTSKNKNYFRQWHKELEEWKDFCSDLGLLPYEACIKFIKGIDNLTGFTFGVGSFKELKEIINAYHHKGVIQYECPLSSKLDLIDPRKWPQS